MDFVISEIEACALEHALQVFADRANGSSVNLSGTHRRRVAIVLNRLRDAMGLLVEPAVEA